MSIPVQHLPPEDVAPPFERRRGQSRASALLGVVLIAGLALIAYQPSLSGGFIWDDELLMSNIKLIRSPIGPYLFWFTSQAPNYWPMTNTSFWLEWRLWNMNPTGYHVTNLLLHLAAAFLVWRILHNLALPGAFLAALLFAVHPVNVESVAWIAQRKNTLAMANFLLSILWYLRADGQATRNGERQTSGAGRPPSAVWFWLSLLAFVLAMLSKGSVAILPAVLLLIVWWQRRRITAPDLIRTAPFWLVGAVFTGVNVWFQKHGLDMVVREVEFAQRLSGAVAVVGFYLAKALAPIHLAFVHSQRSIEAGRLLWWLPLAAAITATVVLIWNDNVRQAKWVRPFPLGGSTTWRWRR